MSCLQMSVAWIYFCQGSRGTGFIAVIYHNHDIVLRLLRVPLNGLTCALAIPYDAQTARYAEMEKPDLLVAAKSGIAPTKPKPHSFSHPKEGRK